MWKQRETRPNLFEIGGYSNSMKVLEMEILLLSLSRKNSGCSLFISEISSLLEDQRRMRQPGSIALRQYNYIR